MSTIDYYNENAFKYFNSTNYADMSKQYEFFLKYMGVKGKILDLGCGSGRDSAYFKKLGYDVDSIDGSRELCRLAKMYNDIDAKCMEFISLDSVNEYDGIWACASLLHVKRNDLIYILRKVSSALKDTGYIYTSMKSGNGEEVTKDGRYFNYLDKSNFEELLPYSNLELVDYMKSRSVSNRYEERDWNNYILKKK